MLLQFLTNVVYACFRRLAHQDFSDYGYLVVAILSHGERASNEDVIIGTDGRQVSLDDITKPFTNGDICKTLIDKLKLFVVQVSIESSVFISTCTCISLSLKWHI